MANRAEKKRDQLKLVGRELRDGDWLANARARSQRRKSPWNLVLALFGLPLVLGYWALLVWLAHVTHAAFHPHGVREMFDSSQPASLGDVLIILPSFVAALAPAFLTTNVIVYQIAPARRAMEAEDRPYPSVSYGPSQRALFKVGCWILGICLPLIFIGAILN